MNVFDWLSNMDMPAFDKFDVVEVKVLKEGTFFARSAFCSPANRQLVNP
jgi:hypothetical protein